MSGAAMTLSFDQQAHAEPAPIAAPHQQRLPSGLREEFAAHFGADFDDIGIAPTAAAPAVTANGADAVTVGDDIAFGDTAYQPESGWGRQLIAHELARVVQQRGGTGGMKELAHAQHAIRGSRAPITKGTRTESSLHGGGHSNQDALRQARSHGSTPVSDVDSKSERDAERFASSGNLSDRALGSDIDVNAEVDVASQAVVGGLGGEEVPHSLRRYFGRALGADLSSVRIHHDGAADRFARHVGAKAATLGKHVYFSRGSYAPESSSGFTLLAHELAHTQQPEAAATVHRSFWDDLVEVAEDAGSAVSSGAEAAVGAAEDVGSAISSGAEAAVGAAEGAGSAVYSGAQRAVGAVGDAGSAIYHGMQQNAEYIRNGVHYADAGIDWLEGQASRGAHAGADALHGVPVLGRVAQGAAWVADQQAQLTGGVLKGASGLLGGVLQVAADPVDTAIGLERIAEHARPFPGMPNPLQVGHGLLNVALGGARLRDEMTRTMRQDQIMHEDARFFTGLGRGVIEPYAESWRRGKYSEVVGRGIFDIGSFLIGAGEAKTAATGAEAAAVVGEFGRPIETLAALGDASRGTEVAGATADVLHAAEAPAVMSEAPQVAAHAPGSVANMSFAGLVETDAAPVRYRSAAEAARGAEDAGLVDLQRGKVGFQTHNVSAEVRNALGQPGTTHQSAHMLAQDMGKGVADYSPGRAPTTNLPRRAHRVMDFGDPTSQAAVKPTGWVPSWQAAKASGAEVTARAAHDMLVGGIQTTPSELLSAAARGTLEWRVFDEMFRELGLSWQDVVLPKRP